MKIHEYNEMMAYLTRPAVNRVEFKPGGLSQRYTKRYNQAITTPEIRGNIKKFYGHKLPKNVEFNFKKHPGVGVPYYGDTRKLANQIRGAISNPGSSVILGMDAEELAYSKKKENLVNIIEEDIKRFEKNEKFFPKEKYTLNQEKLKTLYKARHGKGIDVSTIKKITDEVYKNSDKVKEIFKGGSISTQLSKKEIDFFNKNYTKKSMSQMAGELSGGKFHESKEFKALRSALMRRRDSLIKEGVLTEADFEAARGAVKTTPEQKKVLQKGGFKKYIEAQERLMDLDPESYGKYKSPSTLDSELKRLLQYGTIRGATNTLPNDFLASFEHFQGITPASITQDPSALRKVGIVGKKYNWKIMGRQGKYSPYQTVKNYLRTAREELKQNDIKAAKKSLDKVNTVYDEVTENLKTVNRQELPKYKIEGSNIVEKNVAGVIKPQTLQKSFDQYFRNIAGYATEKDLARIKKTQPNVAKALKLYKEGNIKEAKNLIGSRISEVRQGHLFSKTVPGLETLIKTVSSMPDDFRAKRYWTLGLKGLGIAAVPLVAYDGYTAIRDGLPPDEVVAKALLGADKLLYKGKEVLQLTPEEREARSVVKQERLKELNEDQMMGFGFIEGPEVDSDLTVEEAEAKWKEGQDRYADFREERDAARAKQRKDILTAITDPQEILSREISAATGGRVGFDEGSKPKSPSRRAFLKGITALAALPIVGKYFKLGKVLSKAKPYYGPAIDKVKGMPEWFPGLVKKLWNEGEDVTKQVAYKERMVVKRGTLEGGDDVDMIYDMDTGDVSIDVTPKKGKYETKSGAYNKEYSLDYKKGELIEEGKYAGSRSADDFGVRETEVAKVDPDGNVDWDGAFVDADEAMSDLTELENFAKKK